MNTQAVYPSIAAAARGLLVEACSIAANSWEAFAVCGGWSPLLRNSQEIPHPGTRDVDLLFSNGATPFALREVVSSFLKSGYLMSAKHEFQVLRALNVVSQKFIFNVDFLHPKETQETSSLFVDHIQLPIPYDDYERTFVGAKSIALPSASFIFDGYIEDESVECVLPSGVATKLKIPLIDEVGLLVTKSKSCKEVKRPRDLFDIYLAITSPRDKDRFREKLDKLRTEDLDAFSSIECINEGLIEWKSRKYPPTCFAAAGVEFDEASDQIRQFLSDLGFKLEPKARCCQELSGGPES